MLDKSKVILIAASAGFIHHESYRHHSFAPSGYSIKPEGFTHNSGEVPYDVMERLLTRAYNEADTSQCTCERFAAHSLW